MTLRTRVAASAALAVAVAVLAVGAVVFASTERRLADQTDRELEAVATRVAALPPGELAGLLVAGVDAPFGRERPVLDRLGERGRDAAALRLLGPLGDGVVQLVRPDGTVVGDADLVLPVDAATRELAASPRRGGAVLLADAEVGGRDVRVASVGLGRPGALQVATTTDARDATLLALRRQLLLAGVLGVVLAGGLGLVVADRAVRPVRRLTRATEDVRRTGDLTARVATDGDDELGRLATSFNGMLAALEEARVAQRQLVADAGHELRTPLTSLRTNLEVLRGGADRLPTAEREALVGDVLGQLDALGRLVDGLVELARGERPAAAPTRVVLGDLVDEVADRARAFHRGVELEVVRDDGVVVAEDDRLRRAVANLVDNAVTHGGGTPVHVTVEQGTVTVRDHGPGIPDEDLPRVFDRFHRAPAARGRSGSGLGLAIVAQVARSHGGGVSARNHPGGGAEVGLRLPVADA